MSVNKLFPCMLAACLSLGLFVLTAQAQTEATRPRRTATVATTDGSTRLETDPIIISRAEDAFPAKSSSSLASQRLPMFNQMLMAAIDARLGSPYVYGAEGPYGFDCSGFVWSAFKSAGINFERGSARALWSRFAPANETERFKFGTLVFFSGLTHIGIVADENGFYHASRSHGVVYSPFNKYWLSRIDGFRRPPMRPAQQIAE